MSVIVIPDIRHVGAALPPQLSNGLINPVVWYELNCIAHEGHAESNSNACCFEVFCCVCFFPFGAAAFICHDCFYKSFFTQKLRDGCNKMNLLYYGGQTVMCPTASGVGLQINVDILNSLPATTVQEVGISIISPVSPMAKAEFVRSPYEPPDVIQVQPTEARVMQVTVPANAPGKSSQLFPPM